MEVMGMLGFVFGLIAFVRIEKLIKTLKEKRILEENYKEE
jgi:Pyruvate/2-oxoacid:ferredoxin oxidoreductase gamma subunit